MNGKHFPDCFIKPSEAGFDMVETSATRFLPRMGFAGGRCLKPVGENVSGDTGGARHLGLLQKLAVA